MSITKLLTAAITLLLAAASGAAAQSYPTKPVQVIVPIPPGGSNDILMRDVAQRLQERLGQPFVVENKAGAAGAIGTAVAAKAAPDGYTLLEVYSSHSINPHLYKNLTFDALKDFAPVVLMASLPMGLFVNPSLPAKNVAEFIALAKSEPGKINYASSGNGAVSHIIGAMFADATGVKLTHVPYRGSFPAKADLLSGNVQAMFSDVDLVQQDVRAGKLRALAVATDKRLEAYPDVPTFVEAGLKNLVVSSQVGVLVPAGTPRPIIDNLNAEIVQILRTPEMTQRIRERGMQVVASTPEEFGRVLAADYERFGKLVKSANITID